MAPPRWLLLTILGLGITAASSAAIFIRLALDVTPGSKAGLGIVLAAVRLLLAAIVLAPTWRGFRSQHYSPQTLFYGSLAGACLGLHFATWIPSLAFTSITASTVLVTTNPLWVVLITWLWQGQRPPLRQWLGIGIALGGGLLVALGDTAPTLQASNPPLGNILALVGSWAVSFYLILGQKAQAQGLKLQHYSALAYTIAALTLLPLPLWFGQSYSGYSLPVYGYMALLALFPQLIGHTSLNWGLRWISPTQVTLVILAEPIGASVLGWLFFQERPGPQVLTGAVLLLWGILVTTGWGWPRRT